MTTMTKEKNEIELEIKAMLIDRLMLPMEVEEIDSDIPLFIKVDEDGNAVEESLELDSVDGLEIMIGIQELYDVDLNREKYPEAYRNVSSLADQVILLVEEKE